ncbi:MAG: hypothetical protein GX897_00400 [Clostridiales bacterium]|nr:hypothetical protein [Clostridiales bacterium]
MKLMKRFISFALALLMLAGLPQVIFAAPKVGDVVDHVLHTDIVTYINGLPIRSYNIKGYTAVIVEELKDYGFYVVWYGDQRKLTVIRLESVPIVGGYTPEKNTQPIGSKAMPVYFTDIVTYLDGIKVDSYNVGGRTIIYVDDLAKFYAKDYVWNPEARTLSLTLKGAAPTDSDSGNDTGTGTEPSGGPVIEKQPESCTAKEGDYATFEVKASGYDLTYQWQREEADSESTAWNWVDLSDGGGISGAKTPKLSVLADLDAIYAGSYRCVITDSDGKTVTSNHVSIIPLKPGIKIVTQPQDQRKKAGEYATLYVEATGVDLKYQWQELVLKYNTDISSGILMSSEYQNIDDGGKYSGTKTNTLTVKVDASKLFGVVMPGGTQKYICLITDRYGMTISSSPAIINSYREIKITEQPQNVTQTENAPAEVHIKAEGDFPLYYRWQFLWLGSWTDVPEENAQFAGVDTQTLSWNRDSSGSFKFRCVVDGPNSEPVISDEVTVAFKLPLQDYQIYQPKTFRGKFYEEAFFSFGFQGITVNSLECIWQQKGSDGKWVDIPGTGPTDTYIKLYIDSTTSGCWYRCTGTVNGHKFTTMPAQLQGTLKFRRQGLNQATLKIKTNGELHWIDIKDYVVGEGLTYEWEGRKQIVPENLYIVETEYRVDRHEKGFEDQIIRTEVNGSKVGISTTARRGRIKKKNPGPLEGYYIFYSLNLYTELYCRVTDRYGEKLTFTVYLEYIDP